MTSLDRLYAPIADDLAIVEDTLSLVAQSDFLPLEAMLNQVLSRGGKRLRPAVSLLCGGFGDYDADTQIPLAASIELLHTATLVHDDVIDDSDTRRGHVTANATFGNPASVMLGDYMFAHAAELVARTGHIGVIRLFADTLMVMAKGELAQDVSAFDADSGTMRDYYRRIHGKTASLFATAGAGGAMMSACDAQTIESLREYGRSDRYGLPDRRRHSRLLRHRGTARQASRRRPVGRHAHLAGHRPDGGRAGQQSDQSVPGTRTMIRGGPNCWTRRLTPLVSPQSWSAAWRPSRSGAIAA